MASSSSVIDRLRAVGLEDRRGAGSPHRESESSSRYASMPRASVFVLLFDEHSSSSRRMHVLLTKRKDHLQSHPGQVCFPGGRQEEQDDNDDVKTAVRETWEEIGLEGDRIEPICRLRSVESVNGLCVTPIVARIKPAKGCTSKPFRLDDLTLCDNEVDAAFAVPLDYFFDDENCASAEDIEWKGERLIMRTYFYSDKDSGREFKIWGLSAAIAHEVARIAFESNDTEAVNGSKSSAIDGMSGYLMKFEEASNGKPFWTRRFFAMSESGQMLHQHDSEEQASRKASSATKKNRIPLQNCDISMVATADDHNGRHEFVLIALDGSIKWQLAASCEEERSRWIASLRQADSSK